MLQRTAAKLVRMMRLVLVIGELVYQIRTSLFLGLCGVLLSAAGAQAQLWETPPLPRVEYSQAPDGMTASVGNEGLHISVCHSSVIHFVATPEPLNTLRQNQPWMLDPKDSCPGAKFQISQTAETAVLTTDTLKTEVSPKWGNIKYSTVAGDDLLRERDSIPRTYEPVELNGEKTFHIEDRFAPDREGQYPGMPTRIQIKIVWVSAGRGSGVATVENPDKVVEYMGKAVSIQQR